MENKSLSKSIILSLSILFGLILLGFFIFKGLKTFSDKDRIVTVKGLAEMNMTATSASIDLSFSNSGDNLQEIIKQSEIKKNAIVAYLIANGYNKNEIKINNIGINDLQRYYQSEWRNNQQVQVKVDRYTIIQSLTIQSKDVKATEDKTALS